MVNIVLGAKIKKKNIPRSRSFPKLRASVFFVQKLLMFSFLISAGSRRWANERCPCHLAKVVSLCMKRGMF